MKEIKKEDISKVMSELGKRSWKKLTPEERSKRATKASHARFNKHEKSNT